MTGLPLFNDLSHLRFKTEENVMKDLFLIWSLLAALSIFWAIVSIFMARKARRTFVDES